MSGRTREGHSRSHACGDWGTTSKATRPEKQEAHGFSRGRISLWLKRYLLCDWFWHRGPEILALPHQNSKGVHIWSVLRHHYHISHKRRVESTRIWSDGHWIYSTRLLSDLSHHFKIRPGLLKAVFGAVFHPALGRNFWLLSPAKSSSEGTIFDHRIPRSQSIR